MFDSPLQDLSDLLYCVGLIFMKIKLFHLKGSPTQRDPKVVFFSDFTEMFMFCYLVKLQRTVGHEGVMDTTPSMDKSRRRHIPRAAILETDAVQETAVVIMNKTGHLHVNLRICVLREISTRGKVREQDGRRRGHGWMLRKDA